MRNTLTSVIQRRRERSRARLLARPMSDQRRTWLIHRIALLEWAIDFGMDQDWDVARLHPMVVEQAWLQEELSARPWENWGGEQSAAERAAAKERREV